MAPPEDPSRGAVRALLGPTNTGKTHRAVLQLLEHRSGMIGLPLRLLAREIYDRVSAAVGESAVALVTGEEKRVPAAPRYWVCTVESMPVDRPVDFLAVDEIQLAADPQRGHIFTDRLLHARGRLETWFLGAATITSALRELIPGVWIDRRPRLSVLRHAGVAELTALPPRSAVVAFSAARVYEHAERLRRRRGGAAVVLGALSPRARNAQVALYQAGEVDYLVATDAIGMGLNMDIDHLAFAELSKYDGRESRPLRPAELAQIAGRSGRYQRDGAFGALTGAGPIPPHIAAAIESHSFPELTELVWRSPELDFSSVDALVLSLKQPPPTPRLRRLERADDFAAFVRLTRDPQLRARAEGPDRLSLLWEVCRIPDYHQDPLAEAHTGLLARVFEQLSGPAARIDTDWMARRVQRLDDLEGDIDALLARIAAIRTWTYISHRSAWVADARAWQERTQSLESQLSDALHDRLTERFVLRRDRAHLDLKRRAASSPESADHTPFARLHALALALPDDNPSPAPPLVATAWLESLIEASHDQLHLDAAGQLTFNARPVAQLHRGPDLLHPELRLTLDQDLGAGARSRLDRRLRAWIRDLIDQVLGPLAEALDTPADRRSPPVRGLLYQLRRGLGALSVEAARPQLRALHPAERQRLSERGLLFGRVAIYTLSGLDLPNLTRRSALLRAFFPRTELPDPGGAPLLDLPEDGQSHALFPALGYLPCAPWALRIDLYEQLLEVLTTSARGGLVAPSPERLAALLSSGETSPHFPQKSPPEPPELLRALGYESAGPEGHYRAVQAPKRRQRR